MLALLRLLIFASIGVVLTPAWAGVNLQIQTERSTFLLYERVDLALTLTNTGDNSVLLDNDENRPWLDFLVTKRNHLPVVHERKSTFAGLTLKGGETKTLRINLTPLFSFREAGEFHVCAILDLPGQGQVLSAEIPFQVFEGRKLFTVTRPVEGSERTYSLLQFSPTPAQVKLYLRVTDAAENVVYTNLGLGDLAQYIEPAVQFDPRGNIHILQPVALSTYLYTRADAEGHLQHQGIFRVSFDKIPPRLGKLADGNVVVRGGRPEQSTEPRERLSDPLRLPRAPQEAPATTGLRAPKEALPAAS